jgi:hypothetical protein
MSELRTTKDHRLRSGSDKSQRLLASSVGLVGVGACRHIDGVEVGFDLFLGLLTWGVLSPHCQWL